MQKAEMAKEIQEQVGLTTKREAVEALDSVLVLLKSILQPGENVSIRWIWNLHGEEQTSSARSQSAHWSTCDDHHLWTTQDVENLQECMRQVLKRTAGPRSTLGRSAFGMFQASKLTEEHEDYCREPKDHRHGA
jgi:uncharacterized protein (DUF2267 family)